eukprot:5762-Heterococcus_DN1.PRE.3
MRREQRDTAQRGVAMFHGDSPIGLPNQKAVAQDLARAQALISATVTAAGTGNGLRQALHAVHKHPGQACAWHTVALAAAAAAAVTAPQHSAAAADLTARSRALLHMTTSISNSSSSSSAKVQQLVHTAQAAAAAGDTAAAIAGYRAALTAAPELPALWCELSTAYEAALKPAAAVAAIECGLRAVGWRGSSSAEAFSAAASSSDSSSDASTRGATALHLQLALLWRRLGNTERAVQCANRACASGRGAPACEFVRAALLLQQHQQQQGDGGVCKAAVEGFKRAAAASSSTSSRLPVPAELLQLYHSGDSGSEQ